MKLSKEKPKIIIGIVLAIAVVGILLMILPMQTFIGQTIKANFAKSIQPTKVTTTDNTILSSYSTMQCSDKIDNNNDGSIDFGGCDCNNNGEIETQVGSTAALRKSLCEAGPKEKVAGYDPWCKFQAGVWYEQDENCLDKNDDSEEAECIGKFCLDDFEYKKNRINKIILVVSDSLRADHLSSYGYERDTSPNIDRFASEGVRFSNDISQARWTLESFTSILSSLHTITHNVDQDNPLDECWVTLPEVLSENGYKTTAFSNGAGYANSTYQGQGFDEYNWLIELDETELNEQIFDWLDSNYEDSFFMMIHYMSPHSPYDAPGRYKEKFVGDEYYLEDNYPDAPICTDNPYQGDGCIGYEVGEEDITGENITDIDYYVAKYDGEISYMDSEFQNLLDHLEELGIKDDTLIVFMADHGEVFARGDIILTHSGLYDDTLHVPLIIRYPPAISSQVIDEQVESIDVMPTILDMTSLSGPSTMQGKSLLPLINGEGTGETENVFSGEKDETGSIRNENWKLIENIHSSNGEIELYDLQNDPEELTDVADENPAILLELEEELQRNIDEYGDLSCRVIPVSSRKAAIIETSNSFDFETDSWEEFWYGDTSSEGSSFWHTEDDNGDTVLEGWDHILLRTVHDYVSIDEIQFEFKPLSPGFNLNFLNFGENSKYYFYFNEDSVKLMLQDGEDLQELQRVDYDFERGVRYNINIELVDNTVILKINDEEIIENPISLESDEIYISLETLEGSIVWFDNIIITGKRTSLF